MASSNRVLALVIAVVLAVVLAVAAAEMEAEESLQDTVKTLKGQVSALLERRQEDYRLLEQSLRNTLEKSSELAALKTDLDKLRQDVRTSTARKNDQLAAQWVTASVSELRAELLELARAHNESAERAARNDLRTQARQDVVSLRAAHQLAAKKCAETRQQVSPTTMQDDGLTA
ncbi:uncharacterized protein LOC117653058 [Thrips palmi]|uniref:Uncharacterized protein LOC117653058 n=1 Tax=Thrips palmi TaxID=161013 RepID=A0A6P9AFA5_THRPL|nr:uncharacterized protein LOC117653058 [Thrips palmi]